MDASSVSDRFHIFEIYRRYCEVTSEGLNIEEDGYNPVNESNRAKLCKGALSNLLELVESSVDKRMSILEEIPMLMSKIDLMADSCEFSRFYNFVFFISRENGQRSITVSRAIMTWKLVLFGRFRLLNQWCSFVEKNQRHNISEDTWRQVLAFSRCVHENLEGYDPEGAWPVLIDEFVEHMYRVNGSQDARSSFCSCSVSETQLIDDSLPGIKIYPGAKRKYGDVLQDQELTDTNTNNNMKAKRKSKNLVNQDGCKVNNPTNNCDETFKHNYQCAVEGSLSKGIAELLSSMSSSQFDRETRVSYTL